MKLFGTKTEQISVDASKLQEQINELSEKINNLPILDNDTNNVIEFNDSFDDEINNNKKRNFWDLFKKDEN